MRPLLAAVPVALLLVACSSGSAQPDPEGAATAPAPAATTATAEREPQGGALRRELVASGLQAPVHATAPRSEPNRIYVVEQAGRIVVVQNGRVRGTPFLDIRNLVRSGGEQGLLSVAFHPRYAQNRRLYVNYTDLNGHTRVVEYRSNGQRVLEGTRRQLLFVRQPYSNHNGGQVAFGPDGRLYVGMGDGGAGGDPENRAQNPASRLGKMLRIDVASGRVSVDAFGLRNPWRFSFDRATGDLWIGDVGQGEWEEIDYLAAGAGGLVNYGWSRFEGNARYSDRELTRGRYVPPVHQYDHSAGCSVTGGFVYRGSQVAAAQGRYFFGDFCSGTVWSLRLSGGAATDVSRLPFTVDQLSSFGETASGELLLVSQGGSLYRLAD